MCTIRSVSSHIKFKRNIANSVTMGVLVTMVGTYGLWLTSRVIKFTNSGLMHPTTVAHDATSRAEIIDSICLQDDHNLDMHTRPEPE